MNILTEPFKGLLTKQETLELLSHLHMTTFLGWRNGGVEFRSGMRSNALIGGREDLTESPQTLRLVGELIARAVHKIIPQHERVCLIGIPMSGTTLAEAASLVSRHNLPFRVMRPQRKRHGAHTSWVDGSSISAFNFYVTIDNTITDGGSKLDAISRLRSEGYPSDQRLQHLVLIDRGIGGPKHLSTLGHSVHSIIELPSLARAFVDLGYWPPARLNIILDENKRYALAP